MVDYWTVDSSVIAGLSEGSAPYGSKAYPAIFNDNGTWKLIVSGTRRNGDWYTYYTGYYWNGSTWIRDDANVINGLPGEERTSNEHRIEIFYLNGYWRLLDLSWGRKLGYYWDGTTWQTDTNLASGFESIHTMYDFSVFQDGGTTKLIGTEFIAFSQYRYTGFRWTGSGWTYDSSIIAGLDTSIQSEVYRPEVFYHNGAWRMTSRKVTTWNGYYWNGSTWVSKDGIASGLTFNLSRSGMCHFTWSGSLYIIGRDPSWSFYGYIETIFNQYTISGNAKDGNGNNLKDVDITLDSTTEYYATTTDINGNYSQTVNQGTYTVVASKSDYVGDSAIVDANTSNQTQNFVLTKIPMQVGDTVLIVPNYGDIYDRAAIKGGTIATGDNVQLYPLKGGAKVAIKEEWSAGDSIIF